MHFLFFIVATVLPGAQPDSDNQCGPRALAICASACGVVTTVGQLDELIGRKGNSTSLLDLDAAAKKMGLSTLPLRWAADADFRETWAGSGIIHVITSRGEGHFFAALACDDGKFLLDSFPDPAFWFDISDLRKHWRWDGTILHIAASEADLAPLQPKHFDASLFVAGLLAFFGGQMIFSRFWPYHPRNMPSTAANSSVSSALLEH